MRALLPDPHDDCDVLERYGLDRPVPPGGRRPWVALDMVSSLDGAAQLDGRSAGLSGEADKRVFRALRAAADVVLAGAGTVRVERYGPPRLAAELRAWRQQRGREETPALAVLSGTAELDASLPLFRRDPAEEAMPAPPLVITSTNADASRRDALAAVATVVQLEAPADSPDGTTLPLHAVLAELAARGARLVVCEGGPILNRALLREHLVDEICLTVSPIVVAGDATRIVDGPLLDAPQAFELAHVLEEDGTLFLRYVARPADVR